MKEVLIIFPDPQLPYSPTTLNLFYELKKDFKVTILTPEPEEFYTLQKVDDPGVIYFENKGEEHNSPSLLKRGINKLKRWYKPLTQEEIRRNSLMSGKAKKIIDYVSDFEGEIIAVDFFALWCVQQAGKKAHLISFELLEYDPYKDDCDFSVIKTVIIQSQERYDYLFHQIRPKCFFIQNSPPYLNFSPSINTRKQKDLVFCGSAMPWFGIVTCLDFIKDYPEYTLTIRGAIPKVTHRTIELFYDDLVKEGRLIINNDYLDATSLTEYISQFRIGFAFYDFYRFENVRSFNYYTAPSGKVFQYLNSGVPIISNKLPGFDFIEQKGAGVLIPYLTSNAIKKAIGKIESDYISIAENAKKCSKDLDFIKNAVPFINHLKNLN